MSIEKEPTLQDRFSVSRSDGDPNEIVFEYGVDKQKIGYGAALVYPRKQKILWHKFYPRDIERTLGVLPEGMGKSSGLGTLAHIETLRDLRALLREQGHAADDFVISHKTPVTPERQEHLKRMGVGGALTAYTSLPKYLLTSMEHGMQKGLQYSPEEVRELREAVDRIEKGKSGFRKLIGRILPFLG